MASLNFNAQQHQPQQAFTPLPDGWYPVMITNSEMKPTRDNNGAYLNLELTVQGGEYNNRKLFARLNLHNQNPVAVEIAQAELSSICHVTGVMQVNDSSQLHGIPFQVKVVIRPPQNGYDASNEIKGYRDINGNDPGKAGGGAPQGAPQAPQGPQGQAPTQPPAPPQNAPQAAPQGGYQGGYQGAPAQQPPQQGGWQPPAPAGSQTPPPPPAPQGQGGWQPPQQEQQSQQQQTPPPAPPQQQQPDQGYVQPPQGGQATPVEQPQQGGEVPPWQRQQ